MSLAFAPYSWCAPLHSSAFSAPTDPLLRPPRAQSIPLDAILEKQRRLREVWKAFTWQQPAARGDAFHYVLQELRLRLRGDVRRKFATEAGTWI